MRVMKIFKTRPSARLVTICSVVGISTAVLVLTALAQGQTFFSKPSTVPAGAYWTVTNDHGSDGRDLVLKRWTGSAWTHLKSGVTDTKANESHLAFGVPVYAIADGEVMTCWRNAPENTFAGAVMPGRDGCSDEEPKDGNVCDQHRKCDCSIPRSGNHVNVRSADGKLILYAHLQSGSVPTRICPNNGTAVADANSKSGPNGFYPEIWVPEGKRAKITKGQFLGNVGNNGASSGPHLHIHKTACDTSDCDSVPLMFSGIMASDGVDGTKDINGQKWKLLSPYGALSGPPQLIKFGGLAVTN